MPTYTYECASCGLRIALQSSVDDRDLHRTCEMCETGWLLRQLDAPNFTMNRRGWDSGKAHEEKS